MAKARIPGPLGFKQYPGQSLSSEPTNILDVYSRPLQRGVIPGPVGRTLWQEQSTSPAPTATRASKPKALIIIGTGHDAVKSGVRLNSDKYFDKAALASFAPYTKGYDITLKHVKSAKEMKKLISGRKWDVVIYFGHGVVNQMALAPNETGTPLKKDELVTALNKAQTKRVYLFGCKAGWTGLARQLSKEVQGARVFGTFGTLDVVWEQRKDANGTFTNEFTFKESLTEYMNGLHTKDGKKQKQRRAEMKDPVKLTDDPLSEPMVDQ